MRMLGWVIFAAAMAASAQTADLQRGKRLYLARCGGCHRIYAPGLMTAEMWKLTVDRMQGELARRGVPVLTADEQRTILAYLDAHSAGRSQP